MENKINIAELLKDCPKGMELDCSMWNNVVFDHIDTTSNYPIYIKKMGGELEYLTEGGHFNFDCDAKCVIFPKGKTTWDEFVPPYKFKEGDVIYVEGLREWVAIVNSCNDNAIYDHVALENKTILHFSDNLPLIRFSDKPVKIRLATEEEKKKLFDAIKENGYKWNSETKTLEKVIQPKFKVGDRVKKKDSNEDVVLITDIANNYYIVETKYGMETTISISIQNDYELVPNKFDINTLKPFDKVLARCSSLEKWHIDFFEAFNGKTKYPFTCLHNNSYKECIPYEGNEHLLGTTDDCDEYFKNW